MCCLQHSKLHAETEGGSIRSSDTRMSRESLTTVLQQFFFFFAEASGSVCRRLVKLGNECGHVRVPQVLFFALAKLQMNRAIQKQFFPT